VAFEQGDEILVAGGGDLLRERDVGVQQLDCLVDDLAGRLRQPIAPPLQQEHALVDVDVEVGLPGGVLLLQAVEPVAVVVGPADQLVAPRSHGINREMAVPAVVDIVAQRRLAPAVVVRPAVADRGGHLVMALAEDVRGDDNVLADDGLRGVPPTVDRRRDPLDLDPIPHGRLLHGCAIFTRSLALRQPTRPRSWPGSAKRSDRALTRHRLHGGEWLQTAHEGVA
jgi:hypothetical protein